MITTVLEAGYPLSFRKDDAAALGDHIRNRRSVDIIGMSRVGISNFLRFFLYHPDIIKTYIDTERYVFIPVDLNDLVERELFPFWTLTLKRIVDTIEQTDLPEQDKTAIEGLFLKTIQSQDLFYAIDSVRQALMKMVSHGMLPTLFFLRFDRIKDAVNPSFFDNLQGLKDATHRKLSYVFTSYRSLDELSPSVFTKTALPLFARDVYMSLASTEDMKTIYSTYNNRYQLNVADPLLDSLLQVVGGYVQYMQLSLIILHQQGINLPKASEELFQLIVDDERITLQSEELWESLSETEQHVLLKIFHHEPVSDEEHDQAKYLWQTGFVTEENMIFSPLFQTYLESVAEKHASATGPIHFSKKEHALYTVLEQHVNAICEREEIIEAVWPESKELGISDWAIDRLVARVRSKLKQQNSEYEIKTIRTRGYQLVQR
jgi:DNA-binding winged helix-turn-helix (wHTH) protein